MPEGHLRGLHSPQIRAARLLHQKKHRLEQRCFLIEGPTLVAAALDAGARLDAIYVTPGRQDDVDAVAKQARQSRVTVHDVEPRTLDALAQTKSPQGIVAVAHFFDKPAAALTSAVPANGPALILILHDIGDPGNAGTLLRSAEAFGASAVCFGPHAVEPYNDKVVRAAMGALFHLPIVRYDTWEEIVTAATQAKLTPIGARAGAPDVRNARIPSRAALVVGNERAGLEGIPEGALPLVVGVPQTPRIESLNAGVAGSILLYELARASGVLNAEKRPD